MILFAVTYTDFLCQMLISSFLLNYPCVSHDAVLGERKSLMSDFHRLSRKMTWLRLCRTTNELVGPENNYSCKTGSFVGYGTQ